MQNWPDNTNICYVQLLILSNINKSPTKQIGPEDAGTLCINDHSGHWGLHTVNHIKLMLNCEAITSFPHPKWVASMDQNNEI